MLNIYKDEIQLEDHINHIKSILSDKTKFAISSIIDRTLKRSYLVGFFLAILELINIKYIQYKQLDNFSDIIISRAQK